MSTPVYGKAGAIAPATSLPLIAQCFTDVEHRRFVLSTLMRPTPPVPLV
jgi:hypothetical protein